MAEGLGEAVGAVGTHPQQPQGIDADFEGGAEGFPPHHGHPLADQGVGMAAVAGAGEDLQRREMLAGQRHDLQGLGGVIDRHHQQPGPLGAGGMEQIKAGGVA
nr:hypothetical protein [Cyanobium sp. Morenito 9A2]